MDGNVRMLWEIAKICNNWLKMAELTLKCKKYPNIADKD